MHLFRDGVSVRRELSTYFVSSRLFLRFIIIIIARYLNESDNFSSEAAPRRRFWVADNKTRAFTHDS